MGCFENPTEKCEQLRKAIVEFTQMLNDETNPEIREMINKKLEPKKEIWMKALQLKRDYQKRVEEATKVTLKFLDKEEHVIFLKWTEKLEVGQHVAPHGKSGNQDDDSYVSHRKVDDVETAVKNESEAERQQTSLDTSVTHGQISANYQKAEYDSGVNTVKCQPKIERDRKESGQEGGMAKFGEEDTTNQIPRGTKR